MTLDVDPNENFDAREPEKVEAKAPEAEEPRAPEQPAAAQPPVVNNVAVIRPKPIQAQEGGVIVGTTFEEQYRMAKLYCASRMLPQAFDTPEKVFTAMQFAYELGLKGITALRNVCVINGTPSLWGDLPLALVKRSGKLKHIREWSTDKEGAEIKPEHNNVGAEVAGAFCRTVRDDGNEVTTWFTVEDARKAGLIGNPKKEIWAKYTRRMLQMRARAQNLKDNFGDVLMGAGIAEYDHNAVIEGGNVVESDQGTQVKDVASTLNEQFLQPRPGAEGNG